MAIAEKIVPATAIADLQTVGFDTEYGVNGDVPVHIGKNQYELEAAIFSPRVIQLDKHGLPTIFNIEKPRFTRRVFEAMLGDGMYRNFVGGSIVSTLQWAREAENTETIVLGLGLVARPDLPNGGIQVAVWHDGAKPEYDALVAEHAVPYEDRAKRIGQESLSTTLMFNTGVDVLHGCVELFSDDNMYSAAKYGHPQEGPTPTGKMLHGVVALTTVPRID
jgi:hypothetical protein